MKMFNIIKNLWNSNQEQSDRRKFLTGIAAGSAALAASVLPTKGFAKSRMDKSEQDDLELQIQRLQAIQEIQNTMGHYEMIHLNLVETRRTGRECFAIWRDDCTMEVSDWGCLVGPDAIIGFWESLVAPQEEGGIFWHGLATPVIEVAGNGQTAKVSWMSPGFETMPPFGNKSGKFECFWCFGRYGCDFIRNPETGEWKIWHLKWFRTIRSDFYRSWYDDAANTLVGLPNEHDEKAPKEKKPNVYPSVFHQPYKPDKVPVPFPATPQPYHDYDGNFRWIYGGEEMEKRYGIKHPDYRKVYNSEFPKRV